jgi:hypothetical protein
MGIGKLETLSWIDPDFTLKALEKPTTKMWSAPDHIVTESTASTEAQRLSFLPILRQPFEAELELFTQRHPQAKVGQFETFFLLDLRKKGAETFFDTSSVPMRDLHKPWPGFVQMLHMEVAFDLEADECKLVVWLGKDKSTAMETTDKNHPLIKNMRVYFNLTHFAKKLVTV